MAETNSTQLPEPNPFVGDAEKPFSSLFENVGGCSPGHNFDRFEDDRLRAISTQAHNAKDAIFTGLEGMGAALAVAADSGELVGDAVSAIGWFTAAMSDLLRICNALETDAVYVLSKRNRTA